VTIIRLICVTILAATTIVAQEDFLKRTPPPVSPEAKLEMEGKLSEAQKHYEANPDSADALIWVGRRLAYLGRFQEAIAIYTKGIARFSADARFYRHRGHRYITLRQFDLAIADLERASRLTKGKPDEIEPDGQPNARNIPTSTLQSNILYHLGLAYYLTGQNHKALRAYGECLKVSRNHDQLVSTTHWVYMSLRRVNENKEAAKMLDLIRPGMDVIENTGYYRLLLMYKGEISSELLLNEALKQETSAASHSVLYGIGNWHLYNGRRQQAGDLFRRILASDQWTSFGYIAAEADVKRFRL
jgi:hypothetical protein